MKKLINSISFIIILIFSFCLIERYNFRNKSIETYNNEFSNADILILGSSHAYCNLNAAIPFQEFGIASACVGQPEQPISMSYFELKSILRKTCPKIVILEMYMCYVGDVVKFDEMPDQYNKALLGFPIYQNLDIRIEAISHIDTIYRLPYILGIPDPYFEIDRSNEKNAGFLYLTERNTGFREPPFYTIEAAKDYPYGKISAYTDEYLRKIIELCNHNNIQLLAVLTPFQMLDWQASNIGKAVNVLDEYGITFIDMNQYIDEIEINLEVDMYDSDHALCSGSEKNSRWLANYIVSNLDIEDRRNNSLYKNWNDVYTSYLHMKAAKE